jgi:ERCC4-related helicase
VTTATFEPGSLVQARGREWVVLPESEPDLLVLRPLGGADDERAAVIPELEQVEHATFPPPDPDDAGNAARAGLLRTALRIGFRSSGGPFRSLAALAVEPRPYQIVPLLMALRQDVVRLLIGDDVGIGKTIEAGLIAAELLAQGDANGLAVLCGPALAEQWREELATKFGIAAEVVLPGTVRRLERGLLPTESLFERFRFTVVSTDYIKQPGHREQFLQGCPNLVIVDEAHGCVLDEDSGGRARMLRYELLRRIAERTDRHLILATATPHSGKDAGFRNLIGLLDPRLATADIERGPGRDLLARHFVQRRRADIRRFVEDTQFPQDRETKELPYRLTGEYRELFDDVFAYARQAVRDPGGGQLRQRVRYWSMLALLRALASSPKAAAETLRKRAATIDAVDAEEADALGRSAILDLPDDETLESVDLVPGAEHGDDPEVRRLKTFAKRADALAGKGDAKLQALIKEVGALLADGFNPVVFCRYIDTAEYVAGELGRALAKTAEVEFVTGALPPEERTQRIDDLTERAEGRRRPVLVATDCLSEGVNLQTHFQAVVHYDLAWNPTRHEQREGRVDRFKQRAPIVRAVTLFGQDNRIDEIVLKVLLRKHDEIRKALGVSVPVPTDSDEVLNTLVEELLIAPEDTQQLMLDIFGNRGRETLHAEWESAAAKEKESRTKFAQHAIKADDVVTELAEIRASLGSPPEIAAFVESALGALGADVRAEGDGFTATTDPLPAALRQALPVRHPEPLPFHRELPVGAGHAHLDRTDPHVTAVARYILEGALDPTLPASTRPARRCGVMRTKAVTKRTTLLLVRFRLHLTLPTAAGEARPMVAEEARLLAFRGAPAAAQWLTEADVADLAGARPSGNIPADQATAQLERVVSGLDAVAGHLEEEADAVAAALRAAHVRVREAAGQRARRQISVIAQKPADLLGVYVYLPEAQQ